MVCLCPLAIILGKKGINRTALTFRPLCATQQARHILKSVCSGAIRQHGMPCKVQWQLVHATMA